MKVWISRDKNCRSHDIVVVWDIKPDYFPTQKDWFLGNPSEAEVMAMKPKQFKRRFGLTPRKGTCKECELTLKEIRK